MSLTRATKTTPIPHVLLMLQHWYSTHWVTGSMHPPLETWKVIVAALTNRFWQKWHHEISLHYTDATPFCLSLLGDSHHSVRKLKPAHNSNPYGEAIHRYSTHWTALVLAISVGSSESHLSSLPCWYVDIKSKHNHLRAPCPNPSPMRSVNTIK
jgi:hypothetical protein